MTTELQTATTTEAYAIDQTIGAIQHWRDAVERYRTAACEDGDEAQRWSHIHGKALDDAADHLFWTVQWWGGASPHPDHEPDEPMGVLYQGMLYLAVPASWPLVRNGMVDGELGQDRLIVAEFGTLQWDTFGSRVPIDPRRPHVVVELMRHALIDLDELTAQRDDRME